MNEYNEAEDDQTMDFEPSERVMEAEPEKRLVPPVLRRVCGISGVMSARSLFALLQEGVGGLVDIRVRPSQGRDYTSPENLAFFCEQFGIAHRVEPTLAPLPGLCEMFARRFARCAEGERDPHAWTAFLQGYEAQLLESGAFNPGSIIDQLLRVEDPRFENIAFLGDAARPEDCHRIVLLNLIARFAEVEVAELSPERIAGGRPPDRVHPLRHRVLPLREAGLEPDAPMRPMGDGHQGVTLSNMAGEHGFCCEVAVLVGGAIRVMNLRTPRNMPIDGVPQAQEEFRRNGPCPGQLVRFDRGVDHRDEHRRPTHPEDVSVLVSSLALSPEQPPRGALREVVGACLASSVSELFPGASIERHRLSVPLDVPMERSGGYVRVRSLTVQAGQPFVLVTDEEGQMLRCAYEPSALERRLATEASKESVTLTDIDCVRLTLAHPSDGTPHTPEKDACRPVLTHVIPRT